MRVFIDNQSSLLLGEMTNLPFAVRIEFQAGGKTLSSFSLPDGSGASDRKPDLMEMELIPEGLELFAFMTWGEKDGSFSISNFDLGLIEEVGFIPLGNHVSVRVQHPSEVSGCIVTCNQTGTTANHCAVCESSSGMRFEVCC